MKNENFNKMIGRGNGFDYFKWTISKYLKKNNNNFFKTIFFIIMWYVMN